MVWELFSHQMNDTKLLKLEGWKQFSNNKYNTYYTSYIEIKFFWSCLEIIIVTIILILYIL